MCGWIGAQLAQHEASKPVNLASLSFTLWQGTIVLLGNALKALHPTQSLGNRCST